jgi:DNA-binding MarR family transcriptional regulator
MIEVTLTAAGRKKVKQINDFAARLGPMVRDGIDDADMEQAMGVLRRLRANAEAMEIDGDD